MKPYYQDGAVTIYHGDCREVLPELERCDLVLTDPPFGVKLGDAPRGDKMQKHAQDGYGFADTEQYVASVAVPIVEQCIGMATRVVVTPGIRCAALYPRPTTMWAIYWPNGAGRGRWSAFTCWTPVLCYGSGPKRVGSIPDTFVTTEQAEANGHPCPKPLKLWMRLLAAASDGATQTIIDPFMGSGTTLRAAKDLGRKAIGIEINEQFCEIAAKRCAQEVLF